MIFKEFFFSVKRCAINHHYHTLYSNSIDLDLVLFSKTSDLTTKQRERYTTKIFISLKRNLMKVNNRNKYLFLLFFLLYNLMNLQVTRISILNLVNT